MTNERRELRRPRSLHSEMLPKQLISHWEAEAEWFDENETWLRHVATGCELFPEKNKDSKWLQNYSILQYITVYYSILMRCIMLDKHGMTGWWLTYPSEKYEFVNWDDEIPWNSQHMESHKIPWFQTTSQMIFQFGWESYHIRTDSMPPDPPVSGSTNTPACRASVLNQHERT